MQTHCLLLCHCDEAHIVLGIAAGLGVTNNVNCILLGLQSGGQKVSIAHVLTIVHTRKKITTTLTITSFSVTVTHFR